MLVREGGPPMRQLRVLRAVGSVAVAGLSWTVAGRLTSSTLSHRHVLAEGGAVVGHHHAPAVLLAAVSVLMACLAGVLVIALTTQVGRPGVGRDRGRAYLQRNGCRRAAVAGRTRTAALAGLAMGSLPVLDALLGSRGDPAPAPHLGVLMTVALTQVGAAVVTQLLWHWCVQLVWGWGRRRTPTGLVALPVVGRVVTGSRIARLSAKAPRVCRGRGPPDLVVAARLLDRPLSSVPTLT